VGVVGGVGGGGGVFFVTVVPFGASDGSVFF